MVRYISGRAKWICGCRKALKYITTGEDGGATGGIVSAIICFSRWRTGSTFPRPRPKMKRPPSLPRKHKYPTPDNPNGGRGLFPNTEVQEGDLLRPSCGASAVRCT